MTRHGRSTRWFANSVAMAGLAVVAAGCGDVGRAGTLTGFETSGNSWREGSFSDTGAQVEVWSVEIVATGGKGGDVFGVPNASGLSVSRKYGGRGCEVRVTTRTFGSTISSSVGTPGDDVDATRLNYDTYVAAGGKGGTGLIGGGDGGSNVWEWLPDPGGAGGGAATAVWRDGISLATAAGGGGASVYFDGGSACVAGTADGGDGTGPSGYAGYGARLVDGRFVCGQGGTNAITGGRGFAGVRFPGYATMPAPAMYGGTGQTVSTNFAAGGGGGGGGECGGGGGAGSSSNRQDKSGAGGAGVSFGWSEWAAGGYAPPSFSASSSPPRVVFHWVQFTTDKALVGGRVGQPYSVTLTADFGETGALTAQQGARWTVYSGSIPGLRLDPATGVLSGTPTTPGTYTVAVEAAATQNGLIRAHSRRTFTIVIS